MLVSARRGSGGMSGAGYGTMTAPGPATYNGALGYTLPAPTQGWFYTTELGTLTGAGSAAPSCPSLFRSSTSVPGAAITWTPPLDDSSLPIPGTYTVEGAQAPASGQIRYFALTITVAPPPPASPPTLLPSPLPSSPVPMPPPAPPFQCDASGDFVVVGAGAGGAAAAAYLQSLGKSAIVLSDGPDNTGTLRTSPAWQTLYNYFGKFSQREVANSNANGGPWQQVVGAGGNNLHNGGVHQLPPVDQLDALLGGDGKALDAALWLSRAPLAHMIGAETAQCNDAPAALLTNITYKYFRGPEGCVPVQRYAYCSADRTCNSGCAVAGCSVDAEIGAQAQSPALKPYAERLRKTTMYESINLKLSILLCTFYRSTYLSI